MSGGATSNQTSEKAPGASFPCRKPIPNTVGISLILVENVNRIGMIAYDATILEVAIFYSAREKKQIPNNFFSITYPITLNCRHEMCYLNSVGPFLSIRDPSCSYHKKINSSDVILWERDSEGPSWRNTKLEKKGILTRLSNSWFAKTNGFSARAWKRERIRSSSWLKLSNNWDYCV